MRCLILFFALLGATQIAVAQSNTRPDPSDPAAPAPSIQPASAFADYKSFQEQKSNAWKQLNQEVANNPGMGAMKAMPGHTMPGMDAEDAAPPMSNEAGDSHDMNAMEEMSEKAMPRKDEKSSDASGHTHDDMATAKSQSAPAQPESKQTAAIVGTGVVQGVDRSGGKIKLAHDPIDALGWPKMTMFFRLKDRALADQVKEGDRVNFTLEKSASGYVISELRKRAPGDDTKQIK